LALILSYTKSLETSTSIRITDATGTYDADDQPGGYGSPNEERSAVNLGLVVVYKSSDGNVGLTVTRALPGSATTLNVTAWDVTLTNSGYHRFGMFTAPEYNELSTYSQYDIVYEPNSDQFYYYGNSEDSLASGFSTSNGWILLTDADILEKSTQTAEDDGYNFSVTNDFLTLAIKSCFAVKAGDYVEGENCQDCLEGALKDNLKILMYRVYSEALSGAGNYKKGQVIIEKTEELCSSSSSCGC
jgi:hypothetical protein